MSEGIRNMEAWEKEQLTLFNPCGDIFGDDSFDYEKILKECIISCKIRK